MRFKRNERKGCDQRLQHVPEPSELVLTSLYRGTWRDEISTFNAWFEPSAVSSHWLIQKDGKG